MEVSSKKEEIDLVPIHTCKKWYAGEVKINIFTARKRSCVFTPVCDSVHIYSDKKEHFVK